MRSSGLVLNVCCWPKADIRRALTCGARGIMKNNNLGERIRVLDRAGDWE